MSYDAELLAWDVLGWWEKAQYWEAYAGKNLFEEEPSFVKRAKEIVEAAE